MSKECKDIYKDGLLRVMYVQANKTITLSPGETFESEVNGWLVFKPDSQSDDRNE